MFFAIVSYLHWYWHWQWKNRVNSTVDDLVWSLFLTQIDFWQMVLGSQYQGIQRLDIVIILDIKYHCENSSDYKPGRENYQRS